MRAFRARVSEAADKIRDGIERSVLTDEHGASTSSGARHASGVKPHPPTGSSSGSRRGRRRSGEESDKAHVRLPLEAAKKLRVLSKGDLGDIIARHLQEKEALMADIESLRDLCRSHAPHLEVKAALSRSRLDHIKEITKVTNNVMVLSANEEIKLLRHELDHRPGGGGDDKRVASLEWKLEEAEAEAEMVREELSDAKAECEALAAKLRDAGPATPATTRGQAQPPRASPGSPAMSDEEYETKVRQVKAELARKDVEHGEALGKLKQAEAKVQLHAKRVRELQLANKKLRQQQQASPVKPSPAAATTSTKADANKSVSLHINVAGDSDAAASLEREIGRLKSSLTAAQRDLSEREASSSKLSESHAKLKQRVGKVQKAHQIQKAESEQLQLQLATARGRAKDAEGKLEFVQADAKVHRDDAKRLRASLESERKERLALSETASSQASELKQASKGQGEARAQLDAAQSKCAALEERVAGLEREVVAGRGWAEERESLLKAAEAREEELERVREESRSEVQDTIALVRQLEVRAAHAESESEGAMQELQDAKREAEVSSGRMVENFASMLQASDRSVWPQPVTSAVESLERAAAAAAVEAAEGRAARLEARVDELESEADQLRLAVEGDSARAAEGEALAAAEERLASLEEERDRAVEALGTARQELDSARDEIGKAEMDSSKDDEIAALKVDVEEWKGKHAGVSEELKSFRQKARAMMEAKDRELDASKAALKTEPPASSAASEPTHLPEPASSSAPTPQDLPLSHSDLPPALSTVPSEAVEDGGALSALRAEVREKDALVAALRDALDDSENTHALRTQSEAVLKQEIRDLERNQRRGKVDLTYVKNVLMKGFETGELSPGSSMVPVLSRLLEFTPDDVQRIHKKSQEPSFQIPTSLTPLRTAYTKALEELPKLGNPFSGGGQSSAAGQRK